MRTKPANAKQNKWPKNENRSSKHLTVKYLDRLVVNKLGDLKMKMAEVCVELVSRIRFEQFNKNTKDY